MSSMFATDITTATYRGRALCAAPASVRVVPSHALANVAGSWAPVSVAVQAVPAGTRGAVDRKAGIAAPTFGQGSRTWSPPLE